MLTEVIEKIEMAKTYGSVSMVTDFQKALFLLLPKITQPLCQDM